MLTRRDALKIMGAALASFVLPAPRPRIDLASFCARLEHRKYDLRLPYEVADWTYASDGYACVRVRPESGDVVQRRGGIPPFEGLSWNHDRLRGWRELPRLQPLLATDSTCYACEGTGYEGCAVGSECPACEGIGLQWVGSNYHTSRERNCPACGGSGFVPPPGVPVCAACGGKASGTFPSVVCLDGRYFAADLYDKARRLGAEFVHDNWNAMPSYPLLKFRFSGGDGLLVGADTVGIERRLVESP
jgi:hypothetical protein